MIILFSPSPCFPLLSPPKPSFFSVKTLTPKVEFSETLRFPKCSTKMQHRTPLRSLQCSSSSSPSIDDEKPPSSRIFVKGLSRSISEGYLMKIFSCFGDITNVKLITSKPSKESIGMGYVWFAREEDALLAVKETNGKFVDGRFIAVVIALPESPSKQQTTMCISQFALANQACGVLPSELALRGRNSSRSKADDSDSGTSNDDDNDDDDDKEDNDDENDDGVDNSNDDGDDESERRRKRSRRKRDRGNKKKGGKHEKRRGERGRGHGHEHGGGHEDDEPRANKDCCRWLEELDESCVCAALLHLPAVLVKPNHKYSIKVGKSCKFSYSCYGI